MTARPRIIVLAYACEPGAGSEPGAGWGVLRALDRFADCLVLLPPVHAPAVLEWRAAHPEARFEVEVVDEPRGADPLKRHRAPFFVAYLRWLRRAGAVAAGLVAERPFDLAWHLTYSTYWLPTPAVDLGLPTVWGPVGGGVTTPARLLPLLGPAGLAGELADLVAVRVAARLPSTRSTWRRAGLRVVQNVETLDRLPPSLRPGTEVLNHALFTELPDPGTPPPVAAGGELVWVSPMESRKGPALALHALRRAPGVRLVMVGDGPERRRIERLAARLGVAGRVRITGRLPRTDVVALLRAAPGAVFTGLREEGGLALAEALHLGTPIAVVGHGGARALAERAADPSRVVIVAPGSVAATAGRLAAAMERIAAAPPGDRRPLVDREAAEAALRALVARALEQRG